MPDISLIPEVRYEPLQPYYYTYDNLPITNILARINLVNTFTDNNSEMLRDSIGDAGSLGNRLHQSLEDDGSLRTVAVDETLHNIGMHTDGEVELTPSQIIDIDPLNVYELPSIVPFVRMLEAERDKLMLVSDEATALRLQIYSEAISTTYLFDDQIVEFIDTDTIQWTVVAPNKIEASTTFPAEAAHAHRNNIVPGPVNPMPDYQNYKTYVPYVEDSLKVFINGVRILEGESVYVPSYSATPTYSLNGFTSDPDNGTFVLDSAITNNDIIFVDFEVNLI